MLFDFARPRADGDGPYRSLAELRAEHDRLIELRLREKATDALWDRVASFLRRGQWAGAFLRSDAERKEAQSLLDYWATLLSGVRGPQPDPSLAPYDAGRVPVWTKAASFVWLALVRLTARPLLMVPAFLVLLVAWGLLGDDFGLPELLWHENWVKQTLAGVGVAMLFKQVCFAAYLLDADRPELMDTIPFVPDWLRRALLTLSRRWLVRVLHQPSEVSQWSELISYLLSTLVPLLALVLLPVTFDPGHRFPLALGVVLSVFLTWALVRSFEQLYPRLRDTRLTKMLPGLANAPGGQAWLHTLGLYTFGGYFLVYAGLCLTSLAVPDGWIDAVVSPILSACLLLGLLTAAYGFVRFNLRRWRALIVVVLLAWGGVCMQYPAYKHRFPGLKEYYSQPLNLTEYASRVGGNRPPSAGGLLDQRECLGAWLRHNRTDSNPRPKLAVVAGGGGGNRAAAWLTVVLARLEDEDAELSNFPAPIRMITAPSGGMVGASYYVATLDGPGPHDAGRRGRLAWDVSEDNLSRVVNRWVLRDLPMMFVPVPYSGNRGEALEEALNAHTGGALTKTFAELAPGEREGWRPSLIRVPVLTEDGRQLLISNLDLESLTTNDGSALGAAGIGGEGPPREQARARYSLSAVELFRLFPGARDQLRLSTAVRMTASTPPVTPVVDLPTTPPRGVIDGAFMDSYGVDVAAGWVYLHRDWLRCNTGGVVLIQARDEYSERERRRLVDEQDSLPPQGPFKGEAALVTTRGPLMAFRDDRLLQVLSDSFNSAAAPDFFTTAVFECPRRISVSWYLTTAERARVIEGFSSDDAPARRNRETLQALKDWWKRPQDPPRGSCAPLRPD